MDRAPAQVTGAPPALARNTLLLYMAAVLAPLSIFAAAALFSFQQIYGDAQLRAARTAQALSEHALRTFRAHDLIITAVNGYTQGWSWDRITRSRELNAFLAGFVRETDDVNTVFLAGPEGTHLNTSLRFPAGSINVADRPFFTGPRDANDLHISAPDVGRINRQDYFSFTRRRPSAGGFDGIISVSVNPRYFSSFYENVLESADDAVALIRGDGMMLVRTPDAELRQLPPDSGVMKGVAAGKEVGVQAATSVYDATPRIVAYHRVGPYPLYVSYSLAEANVWAAWRRNMPSYALVCLLAMGLLLAAAAVVRRRLDKEREVERQYAEEAARRAAAEQENRAKDEFLAALSHELRNPLSALANAAELLKRLHGADPASGKAVGIMTRQMAHLKRLLDDLLDVARINFGKLALDVKAVDLHRVARDAAADMTASGKAASIAVSGEPVTVAADPARLRQMIENLLDNARKYGGGTVRVDTTREGEFAEVAVADDGQGIEPELLPRLFEPFVQGRQTIDRAKGGLGLGLALVNRLAQLHGGSLSVKSGAEGSVFTLRLPVVPAGSAGEAESAGHDAAVRRSKLLLVEDQEDARETLETVLRMEGHEVQTAGDGPQALERLRTYRPDIVLIDIGLPGMNGHDLARAIRGMPGQNAMLIALTGYGQQGDRDRSREAGFTAHLIKPVAFEDLRRYL